MFLLLFIPNGSTPVATFPGLQKKTAIEYLDDTTNSESESVVLTFEQLFWKVWKDKGYKLPDPKLNNCYMFELWTPLNKVLASYPTSKLQLHGIRNLSTCLEILPETFALQHNSVLRWDISVPLSNSLFVPKDSTLNLSEKLVSQNSPLEEESNDKNDNETSLSENQRIIPQVSEQILNLNGIITQARTLRGYTSEGYVICDSAFHRNQSESTRVCSYNRP